MKRMQKIGLFLSTLVLCCTFASVGTFHAAEQNETIAEGVSIGNMAVGGMTVEEATEAIAQYQNTLMETTFTLCGATGNIEVTAEDMGIAIQTENCVQEALEIGTTGNLIERFKMQKELDAGRVVIDMHLTLDQQKTARLIYDHRSELEVEAEDNRLERHNGEFSFVEGQKGIEVDIVASVKAIETYLAEHWDGIQTSIDLVTNEVEPRGSKEELSRVQDVIGSFTTDFSSSGAGRAQNVKNGTAKLNAIVLYPGDELSVYESVSPFSEENGYELAGSYSNGTTVETFGGGICQVSTTLYNAAIRAELEILKRYNHSMVVNYVDLSADAAIAGTYKDLRIRNNKDYPVYIQGYCEGGLLYFNIYGEEDRPSNRKVTFESEVLETKEPEVQLNLDSGRPIGYVQVEQKSHTGYESRLWKIVTVDGVEESREVFNNSTYQESPRIVTVGTKGASEEQLAALQSAVASKDESRVRELADAAANQQTPEDPEADPGSEEP